MTDPNPDSPKRMRRSDHYTRARARREAKDRANQRYYRTVFSVSGVLVMFVLLIAAIAINGGGEMVGDVPLEGLTSPWLFGLSKLEVFGLLIVAVIAAIAYWRMSRKR